ncbi:MAG: phospholipase D family protein [Burkholderiales bacterium]
MRQPTPWLAAALATLVMGCASLPPLEGRHATTAVIDTGATPLGQSIAPRVAAHPGKTGIYPLTLPADAFAARALLAAEAQRSLDVQYYIWHGDETGMLLAEALWRAAERGVRVRLLLDDNGITGLDPTLAALDSHPNIEVRLYNPLPHRGVRALNFLADFSRANRRMHNKSFTADNEAAIVGGRNVGNEYFGAGEGVVFQDLDVIAVGPAVREVSRAFDLYWNSDSAYPAASILGPAGADARAMLEAKFAAAHASPAAAAYLKALRETPLVASLVKGRLPLQWAEAQLVYDDPAKTLDTEERTDLLLLPKLLRLTGRPEHQLDLISPYFVPRKEGTAAFAELARDGVKVRILTNSLAASDVAAVHAGYAKRREDLLRAGVRLFELKPTLAREEAQDKKTFGGSSGASLHAKTFAVDRERAFVGSFNFDPRSARLNTEMGLVIRSPVLAQAIAAAFDSRFPTEAYEVRLDQDRGSLYWIERTPKGETRYDHDPGTGLLKRLGVGILSLLPIEWLL